MVIHDFEESKFNEYLSKGIVVVDFFATWCGPCKMIAPELESLVKENPNITVVKIDIDKYPTMAQKYGIMSVPTLLLFKDGNNISNQIGYMPKDILKNWIDESSM